jgi:hypothetical protein
MPPEASGSSPATFPSRNRQRERANQSRFSGAQLVAMRERKSRQQLLRARSKAKLYLAPVAAIPRAADPPAGFQPPAQLDGAVMANLHSLSQHSDRGIELGPPFDRQKRLVLLRLEICRPRRPFAEIQEAPYFVPKIREGGIIDRSCARSAHQSIISYYDIKWQRTHLDYSWTHGQLRRELAWC